jgi:hypothetical protein
MGLTLNALTALRVIRAIRSGAVAGSLQMRCDLIDPDPSPATRWTKRRLASATAFLQPALGDPGKRPLDVLVSSMDKRLQAQCAHSTFRTHDYPPLSFIDHATALPQAVPSSRSSSSHASWIRPCIYFWAWSSADASLAMPPILAAER